MINKRIKKQPYKNIIVKPTINLNVRNIVIAPKFEIKKDPKLNKIKNHKLNKNNITKQNKLYATVGKIEPVYKGETIFIIGGGPSLQNFDFSKLENKISIVINKAILYVPFAQVMYWTDSRVYDWYQKEIDAFKGLKVTNKPRPIASGVINLLDTGKMGLELLPNGLRHGNNSGYAAINLAYHLGAKKIVLLGFDMQMQNNNNHWHDGYKLATPKPGLYKNTMIPNFETLVEPLKAAGVEVYNACPSSALECFTKIPLTQALLF